MYRHVFRIPDYESCLRFYEKIKNYLSEIRKSKELNSKTKQMLYYGKEFFFIKIIK